MRKRPIFTHFDSLFSIFLTVWQFFWPTQLVWTEKLLVKRKNGWLLYAFSVDLEVLDLGNLLPFFIVPLYQLYQLVLKLLTETENLTE